MSLEKHLRNFREDDIITNTQFLKQNEYIK